MKLCLIFILAFTSLLTFAGFEGMNAGTSLKIFNRINCASGVECTKVGDKFTLNVTGSSAAAHDEGINLDKLAIFDYDFAVDGGAIGTIATGVDLPANAVIEKCWFRVETQLVDAGSGTLAVQCEDAGNILAAGDQTGVAAGAFLASDITGTAANMVDDIAASCDLSYVIAGAALTAGKIRGYCRYSVHE